MEFFNGFLTWQVLITFAIGFGASFVLIRRRSKEVEETATLKVESQDQTKAEETVKKYTESNEYKATLEKEFLRGKIAGAEEELGRFTIQLTPFVRKTGGVLNFVGETGYQMQLYYRGFPIGDATERVVDREQKVKTEEVVKLMEAAGNLVEKIASAGIGSGLPIKTLAGIKL